jgi:ATP-dependent Clp protease, protease subunit
MGESIPPVAIKTAYATFAGALDQASLTRIFNSFTGATQQGYGSVHLLFQSAGGVIGDGVSLYNFFLAFPLEFHIHNTGAVQSIAVPAYLGARHRHVSKHGTFMVHKAYFPAQSGTNASRLKALSDLAASEDTRMETIIKARCQVPEDRWVQHALNDVTFGAQESVDFGIAHDIREWAVPKGEQIYNI